jgi:hypothetical protein
VPSENASVPSEYLSVPSDYLLVRALRELVRALRVLVRARRSRIVFNKALSFGSSRPVCHVRIQPARAFACVGGTAVDVAGQRARFVVVADRDREELLGLREEVLRQVRLGLVRDDVDRETEHDGRVVRVVGESLVTPSFVVSLHAPLTVSEVVPPPALEDSCESSARR